MSSDRKGTWETLRDAARAFATAEPSAATAAAAKLSEAAKEWAEACGYRPPRDGGESSRETPRFGFGSGKGRTPAEVDDKSLSWYARVLAENVEDPSKARWRVENQALLEAVEAEMESR